MDPVAVLRHLGGSARRADLLRQTTRRALDRAVREKQVERLARGRYALVGLPSATTTATELCGVLSHESAAKFWLLETVAEPTSIHITVPPRSHRPVSKGVTVHYAEVPRDEPATPPLRTVLDCARTLPFREGLAIADSALRRELLSKDELLDAAQQLRSRGRRRALEVARHSCAAASNPFESALRAIVIEARLTGFVTQLTIEEDGLTFRVDLGDPERRLVAEADSFEFHGKRAALDRDCRRYDELISRGWLVLRFSWEQVMFDPEWVREKLIATCQLRTYRSAGFTGRTRQKRL
jgi:very-short-patch-repair endonuclease